MLKPKNIFAWGNDIPAVSNTKSINLQSNIEFTEEIVNAHLSPNVEASPGSQNNIFSPQISILESRASLVASKKKSYLAEENSKARQNVNLIDRQVQATDKALNVLTEKLMDCKGRSFIRQYFTGIAFVCFKNEQGNLTEHPPDLLDLPPPLPLDKEDVIDRFRQISYEDQLVSRKHITQRYLTFHG